MKVLITDSLFLYAEHEAALRDAGHEVVRLDKPDASEDELIDALRGMHGYVLGGLEFVTDKVIEQSPDLKAIAFTGTDWKQHIPGWQTAQRQGVAISNTPSSNAIAAAEWGVATGLAMVRNLFSSGRTGSDSPRLAKGFSELNIGVVGLGHIGTHVCETFTGLGAASVSYWSRSARNPKFQFRELGDVFRDADIVYVCVSIDAGIGFLDADKLACMKDGALVTLFRERCLDEPALLKELQSGRLRAFLDFTPATPGFDELDLHSFYCSNVRTCYNTSQANTQTSDMATQSILALLATGEDQFRVL